MKNERPIRSLIKILRNKNGPRKLCKLNYACHYRGDNFKFMSSGALYDYLADFIERQGWTTNDLTKAFQHLEQTILRAVTNLVYSQEDWVEPYREHWKGCGKQGDLFYPESSLKDSNEAELFSMCQTVLMETVTSGLGLLSFDEDRELRQVLGTRPDSGWLPRMINLLPNLREAESRVLWMHFGQFLNKAWFHDGLREAFVYDAMNTGWIGDADNRVLLEIFEITDHLKFVIKKEDPKTGESYIALVFVAGIYNPTTRDVFNYRLKECKVDMITALQTIKQLSIHLDVATLTK